MELVDLCRLARDVEREATVVCDHASGARCAYVCCVTFTLACPINLESRKMSPPDMTHQLAAVCLSACQLSASSRSARREVGQAAAVALEDEEVQATDPAGADRVVRLAEQEVRVRRIDLHEVVA